MPDLRDFLVRATLEPAFRSIVKTDPDRAFAEYTLTDAEKEILRRQDLSVLQLIGQALAEETRTAEAVPVPTTAEAPAYVPVSLPELSFEVTLSPTLLGQQLAYRANIAPLAQPVHRRGANSPSTNPWGHARCAPEVLRRRGEIGEDRHAGLLAVLEAMTDPEISDEVPPPPCEGPAEITVIGLGITNRDHLTLQAIETLERARVVFYLDTGVATRALLETHCDQVVPLFSEAYKDQGSRVDAYHYVAARVVAEAMNGPGVVFAIQGHPTVFCYPPFLIRDLAQVMGLVTVIQPGISAMDCLLAELGVDPSVEGLQMYEATDMLLRRRPLQADVPLLIWQIGTVETRLHTRRPSRPGRLMRFVGHLLQYYPPDHPVTVFFSAPHPLVPSAIETVRLDALPAHAPALHPGVTLFLPAVGQRAVHDLLLLEQVDSVEHLAAITSNPGS